MASSLVSQPVAVTLPRLGVFFAESVHHARFRMAWRSDPFHKLIYVLQNQTAYQERAPAREILLAAGSLIAIPAGVEHRLHDREPATVFLLCLSGEFVQADREMASLWSACLAACGRGRPLGPWWRQRMESLWRRAVWEQAARQPGSGVAVKAAAAQVLVHLARLVARLQGGDPAKRIAAVLQEIEESFFDEWSLDRAAARTEMSRRAFSGHFRRHAGQTFLARLTELRLNHAARLLRQGHHSIVGAAFSSGYRDLSHFYRLFGRRYRMTPSSFRKLKTKT
jgi:AraC-like DNA-binding protein